MGFALFTSSGTFNPSTYGLSPGDLIHVKCVGGGGGGGACENSSGSGNRGTNGGASSFGSILSAAGGLAGAKDSRTPTFVAGSCPGTPCGCFTTLGLSCYYGGNGGNGWHPQFGSLASVVSPYRLFQSVVSYLSGGTSIRIGATFVDLAAENVRETLMQMGMEINHAFSASQQANAAESLFPWGHAGSVNASSTQHSMCAGGIGYGAGGGSGQYSQSAYAYGYGGSGGVISDVDYVLPSTAGISVTVGAGGTGYSNNGGGGARGCVAIWW